MLPHLRSGWEVDQAILTEEDRVVVIRFGRDADQICMVQDEVLFGIAEKVKNFAVIYLVDIDEVPDFNGMYELYDACTTMFFYRNKHIMVDLGTGNNNVSKSSISRTIRSHRFDVLFVFVVVHRPRFYFRPCRRVVL
jgi:DIM1 family U5 snRNP protein